MKDHQTVVVAWTEMSGLRPTGRMCRPDGVNYRTEYETCLEAKAVVWLNHATPADLARAHAYAANMRVLETDRIKVAVYTFPTWERDPLGKARARILPPVSGKGGAA